MAFSHVATRRPLCVRLDYALLFPRYDQAKGSAGTRFLQAVGFSQAGEWLSLARPDPALRYTMIYMYRESMRVHRDCQGRQVDRPPPSSEGTRGVERSELRELGGERRGRARGGTGAAAQQQEHRQRD